MASAQRGGGQSNALVLRQTVEKRIEQSAALCRRAGIEPDAFQRVVFHALRRNRSLVNADPASIDQALSKSLELGLLPDGNQAAIVVYKGQATLLPMIEGRLMLARQAQPGISFHTGVVYEGDEFEYVDGLEVVLRHVPNPEADRKPDKLRAAYAIARLPGANHYIEHEVHFLRDLIRYRDRSSARKGPWTTDFAEMCKKTTLGQLLKRLPKVPGQTAITHDMDYVDYDEIQDVDVDEAEPVVEAEVVEAKPNGKPKQVAPPEPSADNVPDAIPDEAYQDEQPVDESDPFDY